MELNLSLEGRQGWCRRKKREVRPREATASKGGRVGTEEPQREECQRSVLG